MPNLSLRVPGFPVLERITGGADPAQPLPLVLVLHGIGGSEEQIVPYTDLKVPARLVYVRGPVSNGAGPNAGHSYFKARFTAAGFMAEVEAMAAQIVRVTDTIASQRAVTRTLVLGYSQGGHVAWLLAATGRFDVVLPVSGALAPGYQPPPPTSTTTIRALHGEDDRTLPATAGAATFRAFSTAGWAVVRCIPALAWMGENALDLVPWRSRGRRRWLSKGGNRARDGEFGRPVGQGIPFRAVEPSSTVESAACNELESRRYCRRDLAAQSQRTESRRVGQVHPVPPGCARRGECASPV